MATAITDSKLEFGFGMLPMPGGGNAPVAGEPSGGNAAPGPLPIFDLASDAPLPAFLGEALPSRSPSESPPSLAPGAIWLERDVILCACPDCRAPMSIRLWLMIADCWNCRTSIELNEEQEREVQRLLQERQQSRPQPAAMAAAQQKVAPATGTPQRAFPTEPASAPPKPIPNEAAPPRALPTGPTPPPRPPRSPVQRTTAAEAARRARIAQIARQKPGVWFNEAIKMTPAWLISLILHFIAITVASLFSTSPERQEHLIVLSATISPTRNAGGSVVIDPQDEVKFDLPQPKNVDLSNPRVKQALLKANDDAAELRLDPAGPNPGQPDLAGVKEKITGGGGKYSTFAARDPRVRVEMVEREGGTLLTEAAVARGLRWLTQQQDADGSWHLHALKHGGGGGIVSDPAGTSLALLPYLGAGQTHLTGRYKDTVAKGLRWLVAQQKPTGDLRGNSQGNSGMYAHGQAAIVLCEAFAMEGDEELRIPAQKALDFIVKAQHSGGGWRYEPGAAGDTSVVGWQLMALQSGRAAGLTVPPETLELADHYLDSVQSHSGSRYAYMPRNNPTHVMTAEALLCRMYLGWTKDDPGLGDGARFLLDNHLPSKTAADIYYWYYGTQAMKHLGGPAWEKWNSQMRDILVETQESEGPNAGSWSAQGPHAAAGGRLYMTALATCTLEVYYRHLPIFRRIDLEQPK